jgi:hypothetical protein
LLGSSFADIKNFRRFTSIVDCLYSQSVDINSVRNWCTPYSKNCIVVKMEVIFFPRKINVPTFNFDLDDSGILDRDYINGLGVFLVSKLHFHQDVDCLFS